jgi:hypothetical protein
MAVEEKREVWTTVSYDRAGNILEVRNRYNKMVEGRHYGGTKAPEEGAKCPEGETEITVVKTVQVVYVTCGDTSDPCWQYDPATRRWYWTCP